MRDRPPPPKKKKTSCLSMHLTRPKSSKGRSRPAVNNTDSARRTPVSPGSPAHSRPDTSLRSRSQPSMRQAGRPSQDEAPCVLRHAPAAPPQSLNKYRVLPSIESRRSEVSPGRSLGKSVSKLTLSEGNVLQQRRRHEAPQTSGSGGDGGPLRIRPKPPDPGPVTAKEAGAGGGLLLAIRAPCGRRFQQHFEPTDTLLTVRASAEARYGAEYGEASVETMDVPRRSFTDMDMTLAQCRIFNRSVLCISQNNGSEVEHD
ncbi:UBX domain-containing protein 10 [Xiphias gladius]|uniref:UBX domain-containing protein 10 n=1 Tax=Xiphias gladius TaxID=8245 RepID=UPI001A99BC7C|nr:UBX domain-containing protein 10 [Xiphias gladius]